MEDFHIFCAQLFSKLVRIDLQAWRSFLYTASPHAKFNSVTRSFFIRFSGDSAIFSDFASFSDFLTSDKDKNEKKNNHSRFYYHSNLHPFSAFQATRNLSYFSFFHFSIHLLLAACISVSCISCELLISILLDAKWRTLGNKGVCVEVLRKRDANQEIWSWWKKVKMHE